MTGKMKLETTAGQLHGALKLVDGVIVSRASLPILRYVKIEKSKNGARIVADNLDMRMTVNLPGSLHGSGLVDYRSVKPLIGLSNKDDVFVLEESDGMTSLKFNNSEYRFGSLPVRDFPEFKRKTKGKVDGIEVSNHNLFAALKFCIPFASKEETRYYLNGVAIAGKGKSTEQYAVATNGHVLAFQKLSFPLLPKGDEAIVPDFAIKKMLAIQAQAENISFGESAMQVNWTGAALEAKLIDGTYPDWQRVVPENNKKWLAVDVDKWLPALRRLYAIVKSSTMVSCKISMRDGSAVISMDHPTLTASEILPVDQVGKEFSQTQIGFSIKYLLSVMSQFKGEIVEISAHPKDAKSNPIMIKPVGQEDRGIVFMPMRI